MSVLKPTYLHVPVSEGTNMKKIEEHEWPVEIVEIVEMDQQQLKVKSEEGYASLLGDESSLSSQKCNPSEPDFSDESSFSSDSLMECCHKMHPSPSIVKLKKQKLF